MNNAFKPQTIEEIENRIEKLRKSYVPEWTFNRYNPDAGSVIAQIFARQVEENNRLMSQMPERYHMEFVNMLDSNLRPAQPAASMVIFNLDGNSIMGTQVPKGTRLTADSSYTDSGYIVYETERNLYVTESRIKCVFMTDAEKGTLTPLYGDIKAPEIVPAQNIVITKEPADTLEEEPEEENDFSLENIEESYKIAPFTLFGEKKTIGSSVLIIYHDRLFEGVDEPIYIRFEGAKDLVERIEKGEFKFKYLDKRSFVEFDSVKLLEDEKTYELITTYRGTRFNNGLPECLEPIRYASRKDTIFKTDKHAVIMVESLRNEYGYRSFVLRNENYSFAWTLVQDDKDKYFIYNDNSLKYSKFFSACAIASSGVLNSPPVSMPSERHRCTQYPAGSCRQGHVRHIPFPPV